jgi:MoaE-MoaD fusion protein
LPDGATVGDLWARLEKRILEKRILEERIIDRLQAPLALGGIAVSVNAEYTQAAHILRDGDEVGLLPPVSGGTTRPGAARTAGSSDESTEEANIFVALTRESIDAGKLVASAKDAEDGAVAVFDGIVRNHSRGRRTLHLDYEAYEEMALREMRELGRQARERFSVRQVIVVHRLGRLEIGETSILIVVASAHRSAAFEACRWLIDTIKQTVPIWKKETFVDGAVWAPGEPFPKELTLDAAEAKHDA